MGRGRSFPTTQDLLESRTYFCKWRVCSQQGPEGATRCCEDSRLEKDKDKGRATAKTLLSQADR